jgi:hypothetical protein
MAENSYPMAKPSALTSPASANTHTSGTCDRRAASSVPPAPRPREATLYFLVRVLTAVPRATDRDCCNCFR